MIDDPILEEALLRLREIAGVDEYVTTDKAVYNVLNALINLQSDNELYVEIIAHMALTLARISDGDFSEETPEQIALNAIKVASTMDS